MTKARVSKCGHTELGRYLEDFLHVLSLLVDALKDGIQQLLVWTFYLCMIHG